MPSKPQFFPSLARWRAWLGAHHDDTPEFWVGFYKRDSGRPSITWPEAVDGALCFGWIDGMRKRIDRVSYKIRFTPRRPRSVWSALNIKRAGELCALGLMHSPGLAAFEKRGSQRSAVYSYEQRKHAKFSAEYEKKFRAQAAAWKFFQSQPPWYRRTSAYWVMSAKKKATRLTRLERLISDSTRRKTIAPLTRPGKRQ